MRTTLDGIRDIRLYQRKDGYRFSVDALLLYSFVNLRAAERIADMGAGSGIVGLLLAKKYPEAEVALIELQEGLFELAEKNIALNGLSDRVRAVRSDIRDLPGGLGGFDLAVSNPPFRRPDSGLLNVHEERAIARHEIEINLKDLVKAASSILKEKGRFIIVYHPLRLAELMGELRAAALEPKRLGFVHGKKTHEAKIALLEAVKGGRGGLKVEPPFFVYEEDGGYTERMKAVYNSTEGQ